MNTVTALFVVVAVFNEIAVLFGRRDAERWLKPGALVALIGVALSLGALDTSVGRWILVALVCSLAGDVFLLGDAEGSFIRGLASFLLGHLAYVVAFLLLDPMPLLPPALSEHAPEIDALFTQARGADPGGRRQRRREVRVHPQV